MASVLVFNEPDAFRVLDIDAPAERIVRAVNQGRWELYLPDEQGPLFAHQQGSIVVITHSENDPKNGPAPIQPAGTAGAGAVGGRNDHRSDRHCAGIECAHDPRLCGQYEGAIGGAEYPAAGGPSGCAGAVPAGSVRLNQKRLSKMDSLFVFSIRQRRITLR